MDLIYTTCYLLMTWFRPLVTDGNDQNSVITIYAKIQFELNAGAQSRHYGNQTIIHATLSPLLLPLLSQQSQYCSCTSDANVCLTIRRAKCHPITTDNCQNNIGRVVILKITKQHEMKDKERSCHRAPECHWD